MDPGGRHKRQNARGHGCNREEDKGRVPDTRGTPYTKLPRTLE